MSISVSSRNYFFKILVIVCFPLRLLGELTWKETTITLTPGVEDSHATAEYTLTNTGKEVVEILKIHTSCGCTTAEPKNMVIAPGSREILPVKFDIGTRKGTQRKTIQVEASDQSEPHTLHLIVEIPKTVDAHTRVLSWQLDDPLQTKEIFIESHLPNLSVKSTEANNTAFTYEIKPQETGFVLAITPVSTAIRSRTSITVIFARGEREFPLTFFSYVR